MHFRHSPLFFPKTAYYLPSFPTVITVSKLQGISCKFNGHFPPALQFRFFTPDISGIF